MSVKKNDDYWSRSSLLRALHSDTQCVRLERLRRLGLLDEANRLTARAKNWETPEEERVISHTAVPGDDEEYPLTAEDEKLIAELRRAELQKRALDELAELTQEMGGYDDE